MKDENGPTTVEYAVMMALVIVGVCIAAVTSSGTSGANAQADNFTITIRNDARSLAAQADKQSQSAVPKGLLDPPGHHGLEVKVAVKGSRNSREELLASGLADKKAQSKAGDSEAATPVIVESDSSDAPKSTDVKGEARKTAKVANNMSEDDARHAIIGGVTAGILFEIMGRLFAYYISKFPTYTLIYGTFSIVPIFLLWIYFSWLVILFGALIAASLQETWRPPAAGRGGRRSRRV